MPFLDVPQSSANIRPPIVGSNVGRPLRSANPLSAVAVAKLIKPGRYAVGDGAYLQIAAGGTNAWVFRYQRDGKARHMGLGPVSLVSLAEAREKARQARRALLDGDDPLELKRQKRAR